MQARIHFQRIGKGESIYTEPLVSDDGVTITTLRRMTTEICQGIFPRAYLPNGSTHQGAKGIK